MLAKAYVEDDRPENFVVMDWGKLASSLNYQEASKTVFGFGTQLATFIKHLILNKFVKDVASVRIVGYNLGAHIGNPKRDHLVP